MAEHSSPWGWILVIATWVFAFIGKLTQQEIAFIVAIVSGALGALSFAVRTLRDYVELQDKLRARKKKKQEDEAVDPKSE